MVAWTARADPTRIVRLRAIPPGPPGVTSQRRSFLTAAAAGISIALAVPVPRAMAWRSALFPENWTPPAATRFDSQMIQDFSYAGYHHGAVAVPNVGGPVFDVLTYGADPTGARDSTVAIQGAIDAAEQAGNGVVHLPAGTYRIRPQRTGDEALRIRASNIVLRGDGPGRTFLFNDQPVMRGKAVIRVASPAPGDWSTSTSVPVALTSDLLTPTQDIPVTDASRFRVGDWVVLRTDVTAAFVAEHRMSPEWDDHEGDIRGVMFYRRIEQIDRARNRLVVDTPIRHQLRVRDAARVYLTVPHVEEVGVEGFSIGELQHPGSGLAEDDYLVRGTAGYDVHTASLIFVTRTRNGWIRNVHSYRPSDNAGDFHMLSNGIVVGHARSITIEGCDLARPQYRGGGGNGYMYRFHGQETLAKDCSSGYARHGFVFSHMQSSGNVLLRPFAQYSGFDSEGAGNDHHQYLSQSNLIDDATVDHDWFEARYRESGARVEHGITGTQSVFWNTTGLAYHRGVNYVVHSQQFGWGYVIGTQGAATAVDLGGQNGAKTDPVDHVEGIGGGATLVPVSLYEAQLAKRLGPREPTARVACSAPGRYVGTVTRNDGASGVLRTRQHKRGRSVAGGIRCRGIACLSRRAVLWTSTPTAAPPATASVKWRRDRGGGPTCHIRLEEVDPTCRRCRGPISCATPPDFDKSEGTVELVLRRCARQPANHGG
jgi:hypothetical protein